MGRKLRLNALTGFALTGLLVGSACSDSAPLRPTPNPELIRIAVSDLGELDPILASAVDAPVDSVQASKQVYEGLVGYDPKDLTPTPALADSWSADPDSRTWTFRLRRNVKFHSGHKFTSADVVYSLNRLAQAACVPDERPEAGAPSYLMSLVVGYADVAQGCSGQALTGIQPIGEYTVTFSLQEPFADFPSVLGAVAAGIVPQGHTSEDPDDGTGAYRVLKPWDERLLTLERFSGYWGRKPSIPQVRFVGFADTSRAYSEMLAGNLEVAQVPAGKYREATRRFPKQGFIPTMGITYLGFNFASARVGLLDVRRVVARAVDRQAVAEGVFDGTRDAAQRILNGPLQLSNDCPDCGRDVGAAKKILGDLAGSAPSQLTLGVAEEGSGPAVANSIARSLGEAGIAVRVVARPLIEHVKGIRAADTDLFVSGWIPAYPAADGVLVPMFRSGAPDNLFNYANPETDLLLAAARKLKDTEARLKAFTAAENQVLADLPLVPLVAPRAVYAFDPNLIAAGDVLVPGSGILQVAGLSYE